MHTDREKKSQQTKRVNQRWKYVARTQQQRPESPTGNLSWHAGLFMQHFLVVTDFLSPLSETGLPCLHHCVIGYDTLGLRYPSASNMSLFPETPNMSMFPELLPAKRCSCLRSLQERRAILGECNGIVPSGRFPQGQEMRTVLCLSHDIFNYLPSYSRWDSLKEWGL